MMIVAQIIGALLLLYALLLAVVPRGVPLYEMLRLPRWVWRLETYPRHGHTYRKIKYGPHFRQYLLHFPPAPQTPDRGLVVLYFHGGGWQFGRPEMFRPNAQTLTERGYHVFLPSHRRLPFFDITTQRADVAAATRKVVDFLQAAGLADKKICLGGMSSGSNLAGLLLYDRSLLSTVGLNRQLFRAAFLLGAPLNLAGMRPSPPLLLLAGWPRGRRFRLADPIAHLEPEDPVPLLLVHPEKDGLVELRNVQVFYEKTQHLRFRQVEYHVLPGMVHTDAASWCFEGHCCRPLLLDWLEKMECQDVPPSS